jgi:hypothetical protein
MLKMEAIRWNKLTVKEQQEELDLEEAAGF